MVGAFPPPVNGMANVNAFVYKHLKQKNANLFMIDLSARNLKRTIYTRLFRIQKVIYGIYLMLFKYGQKESILYLSISGGLGKVYEIVFLLLARMRKMKIYLHHHSFSYINRRSKLYALLQKIAGSLATHVTLCSAMAVRLKNTYPNVHHLALISNAALLVDECYKTKMKKDFLKTVGFLSNISEDKGINEFLNLMEMMITDKINIKGKIAGPFQDIKTELEVRLRIAKLRNVEYVGPKYGKEKIEFLKGIDVLVLPTHYVNEAEPLTIHEAMKLGLPVISYNRGCISEIVNSESGRIIDSDEPFSHAALNKLKEWFEFPAKFKKASRSARTCYLYNFAKSINIWENLILEITDERKRLPEEISRPNNKCHRYAKILKNYNKRFFDVKNDLKSRVNRECISHTDSDILLRNYRLKKLFKHINQYPSRNVIDCSIMKLFYTIKRKKVLDYGCGRGELSLKLLKHGAYVCGIDISPIYINDAINAAKIQRYSKKLYSFKVMDAHFLDFENCTFDYVIGNGILHHLEIREALSEIYRVLKIGGSLIVLEPLADNPLIRIFRFMTPYARTRDEKPLSLKDLKAINADPHWKKRMNFCGILEAPIAIVTSIIFPNRPKNYVLKIANHFERCFHKKGLLMSWNQYVLLNLEKI